MIVVGKYAVDGRWVNDFWTIDGKRQYITFTKTVQSQGITYGFIFFNLSIILGISNAELTNTKKIRKSWIVF
jgi:hypothetical protein